MVGYVKGITDLKGVKAHVADVHRPLLCMAEVVDNNFRVVFDTINGLDASYALDKNTGNVMHATRRNNVYETEWAIVPHCEVSELMQQEERVRAMAQHVQAVPRTGPGQHP